MTSSESSKRENDLEMRPTSPSPQHLESAESRAESGIPLSAVTGEHLLLALYEAGRLWFRSPFEIGNDLGDLLESYEENPPPRQILQTTLHNQPFTLADDQGIYWENLIEALQLPLRTMPGRDPEEIWIPPQETDRIENLLQEALENCKLVGK
jgi:hypothetical protein